MWHDQKEPLSALERSPKGHEIDDQVERLKPRRLIGRQPLGTNRHDPLPAGPLADGTLWLLG